jgi:Protein of unknown function (DUF3105)
VSISTPQGGNNSDSGVVRIKRNAVAGAGKPPADDDAGSKPTDTSKSAGTGTGAAKSTGAKSAGTKAAGAKSAGAKSTGAKAAPGARTAAGGGGPRRPGGGPGGPSGGRGGRRPAPVVVAKSRNWTAIALVTTAVVVFVAIVGYGVYAIQNNGQTFQDKADKISGIVDYRKKDPSIVEAANRNHVYTKVNYPISPPAYGNHNFNWQRCLGDVYPAQIANENAVHSLEHGAIWITYDPAKLSAADVQTLASTYVKGQDFTLMSPYPNMPTAISLQAWGFQLRLNSPTDPRIKQFIQDLRVNATLEPGANCSSGTYVTATGTTPHNLGGVPAPSAAVPAPSASQ